jgi:glycosyltransferase involved in cell wall biosynthesis
VRISVVVPTLNRVDDLRRCLAALARQTRPADRIVVVVHDSDAATQEALAAWRDRGSEVSATTVRARGLPAALNAGLDAVAGDVICFTDDDAEPWPDWLARIEAHYRDPSVGAVSTAKRVRVSRKPMFLYSDGFRNFGSNSQRALSPNRALQLFLRCSGTPPITTKSSYGAPSPPCAAARSRSRRGCRGSPPASPRVDPSRVGRSYTAPPDCLCRRISDLARA